MQKCCTRSKRFDRMRCTATQRMKQTIGKVVANSRLGNVNEFGLSQPKSEFSLGEEPPGGCNRGEIVMEKDVIGGDSKLRLKPPHQRNDLFKLPVRKRTKISVANQADSDGVQIEIFGSGAGHVRSGKLAAPSVPDVDHAVPQALAVANHKVVAKAVVTHGLELSVQGFRRACRTSRIMNDDGRPTRPVQGGLARKNRIDFRTVRGRDQARGRRDKPPRGPTVTDYQDSGNEGHGSREACPDQMRPFDGSNEVHKIEIRGISLRVMQISVQGA